MSCEYRCRRCGHESRGQYCESCGFDKHSASKTRLVLTTSVSQDHWRRVDRAGGHPFPDPPPPEQRFEVDDDVAVLGRQGRRDRPDVTLALSGPPTDPAVSRRHCVFERRADGSWVVRDDQSSNGVWVNDARAPLALDDEHELADGDRLYLGAWTCITVQLEPLP